MTGELKIENLASAGENILIDGAIDLLGNLDVVDGYDESGTGGEVRFVGTGAQTYAHGGSGYGPAIRIDKSSGAVTPEGGTTTFRTNTFNLVDGDFTAPSGDLLIFSRGDVSYTIFAQATGSNINFNGGNIVFRRNDYGTDSTHTINLGDSLSFNNLSLESNESSNGNDVTYALTGPTPIVTGELKFDNPNSGNPNVMFTGIIDLHGNLNIVDGVDNNSLGEVHFVGSGAQTYDHTDGNGPIIRINKTSGAVTPASGNTTFAASQFFLDDGDFTAPSGVFKLFTRGEDYTIFTQSAGSNFFHNNGTVTFEIDDYGTNETQTISLADTLDFNNVTLSSFEQQHFNDITYDFTGSIPRVLGDLTYDSTNGDVTVVKLSGTLDLYGNLNSIDGADGGPGLINFKGANNQTVTVSAGNMPEGNWTVDKTGGVITQATNLNINGGGQTLTIEDGDWDMAGFDLTAGATILIGDSDANPARLINNAGCPPATVSPGYDDTTHADGSYVGPTGTPSISVADVSADEADGSMDFTLTMSEAYCSGDTVVQVDTANITAASGTDYTAISAANYTFATGEISKTVTVILAADDATAEFDKLFSLALSNQSGHATLSDPTAIGTILNDDWTDTDFYVWTGANSNTWGDAGNWSPGIPPVDGSATVAFNGDCVNCNPGTPGNMDYDGVWLYSTYTGTITQSAGNTLDLNSRSWRQLNGEFSGSTGDITILSGNRFDLYGGNFISTADDLIFNGTGVDGTLIRINGGTFDANGGTVEIRSPTSHNNGIDYSMYIDSAVEFNNLTLRTRDSSASGYSANYRFLGSEIPLVKGDLSFINNSNYNGSNVSLEGTIDLEGNFVLDTTGNTDQTQAGTIRFVGTNAQTYLVADACFAPRMVINKPSGTVSPLGGTTDLCVNRFTLTSGTFETPTGFFRVVGNTANQDVFTYIAGTFTQNGPVEISTSDDISNGTYTYTLNVAGVFQFDDLKLQNRDTVATAGHVQVAVSTGSVEVNGDLTIERPVADTGTVILTSNIDLYGDLNINAGAGGGSGKVRFVAAADQNINYTAGFAPELSVVKPSNSVLTGTDLAAYGFTLSSGTFEAPSNNFLLEAPNANTSDLFRILGGTYNHNNGTLQLDSSSSINSNRVHTLDVSAGASLYNLTLTNSDTSGTHHHVDYLFSGGTTTILGDLLVENQGAATGRVDIDGSFDIHGDVTVDVGGSQGDMAMNLVGTQDQNINVISGELSDGNVTVNKPSNSVIQLSNISFADAGQTLNINDGDWDMGGFDLTAGATIVIGDSDANPARLINNAGCPPATVTPGYDDTTHADGSYVGPTGTPSISVADVSADEADGSMDFTLTMSEAYCSGDTVVQVDTADDTAAAGTDYTAIAATNYTFAIGEVSKTVTVTLAADNATPEFDKWFNLNLSNQSGHATISDPSAVGTILNDDWSGANFYLWTGATDDDWSDPANWSPGVPPVDGTPIIAFNDACTTCNTATVANVDASGIWLHSNYTGTVTQTNGHTIDVGSDAWQQLSGDFVGGNASSPINFSTDNTSHLRLYGGSFTSTAGTLRLYKSLTILSPTVFNHNNGKIWIDGNNTTDSIIDTAGYQFYDFDFNKTSTSGDLSIVGTLDVNGKLVLDGNPAGNGNQIDDGDIYASGDIDIGAVDRGTGTIYIDGAGARTVTDLAEDGTLSNLEVTSGTVTMVGTITINSSFTVSGGSVNWGTATFRSQGSTTLLTVDAPGVVFNNFTMNKGGSGDMTVVGSMDVDGILTFDNATGGNGNNVNTGTIEASGNVVLNDLEGGSGTLVLNGSVPRTFTGAAGMFAPNLTINSTSSIDFTDLGVDRNFVYTQGTVNFVDSKIDFGSSGDSNITSNGLTFPNVNIVKTNNGDIVFTDAGDIDGNLHLNSTGSNNDVNGTFSLAGDLTIDGNDGGNGSITFDGSGDQTVTVNAEEWPSGAVAVNKSTGSRVIQATNVTMDGVGQTLTVADGDWDMGGYDLTVTNTVVIGDSDANPANLINNAGCPAGTVTPGYDDTTHADGSYLVASGSPSLSIADVEQEENFAGTMDFTVTMSEAYCAGETVVRVDTSNGLASAGSDYTAITAANYTFAIGETTKSVDVTISGDSVNEFDENFSVTLSNPSVHATISDPTAIGTILNDDWTGLHVWTGATNSDWNTGSNWLGGLPANDGTARVAFSDACDGNPGGCNLNTPNNINVEGIWIYSSYTGTLTQDPGHTLDLNDDGFLMSGGEFVGGNSDIDFNGFNGSFIINSGEFTSTSGTLYSRGTVDLLNATSFSHNSGVVSFANGSSSDREVNFTGHTLYDLIHERSGVGDVEITGVIDVARNFTINSSGTSPCLQFGEIRVGGDLNVQNMDCATSEYDAATLVTMIGSGTHSITGVAGAPVGGLHFDGTGTFNLSGDFAVTTELTHTQGTVNAGTSHIRIRNRNGTATISVGSEDFYDLTLETAGTGDINVTGTLSLLNDLTWAPTGSSPDFTTGTIEVEGDLSIISGTGGVTGLIKIVGAGPSTITGTASAEIPSLEIDSSGTVNFAGDIYIDGDLTHTSGSVVAGSSSVNLKAGSTVAAAGISFNDFAFRAGGTSDFNVAEDLDVNGNLIIDQPGTSPDLDGASTINLAGNLDILDNPTTGDVIINFDGSEDQYVSQTAGQTAVGGNFIVNKSAGQVVQLTDVSLSSTGQSLNINDGDWNMAGFDLTANSAINVGDTIDVANTARLFTNCGTPSPAPTINAPDGQRIDSSSTPDVIIDDPGATEGDNIVFTVTFSEAVCSGNTTVDYAVNDSTALVAQPDYNGTPTDSDGAPNDGTLTIPEKTLTGTITVSTQADVVAEQNEELYIQLSNPSAWATITDDIGYGTIITDEYLFTCDSGDLATNCYVNTVKAVADGDYVSGGGNLIIQSGGSIQNLTNLETIEINMFGDITVESGGSIQANLTNFQGGNININAGGDVNADGLGSLGGYSNGNTEDGDGTGGGTGATGGSTSGGGGSYAGLGGAGMAGTYGPGPAYGTQASPTDFGSGGGGIASAAQRGGDGGGVLYLFTRGQLTLDGDLTVEGETGVGSGTRAGGGGSGGTLRIESTNIAGAGNISVSGGNGGSSGNYYGGGGGGGRLYTANPLSFSGSIDLQGGTSGNNASSGEYGESYIDLASDDELCDTGDLASTCTITSVKYLHDSYSLSGGGDLIIDAGGSVNVLKPTSAVTINMTGDVTVQNGGNLQVNLTDLIADNLTIGVGSTITAQGLGNVGGFLGTTNHDGDGTGGGFGHQNGSRGGGGGGYGGAGGQGDGPNSGGTTYGNANPGVTAFTFGSGGGAISTYARAGGNGGGLIKLSIANNTDVSGTISVEGNIGSASSNAAGGGGSGGGLHIVTSTISGTGTLSVKGGNGNNQGAYDSGGGGGGRIALFSDNAFEGTVNIEGGIATGTALNGGKGTFYFDLTDPDGLCDSGVMTGTCTITSNKQLSDNFSLSGAGNLVIGSGGSITVASALETISIILTGDITVQSGGSIVANISNMSADNITVDAGGLISANALGYFGGYKSGTGRDGQGSGGGTGHANSNRGGGGGGYGGAGGAGDGPNAGGSAYNNVDPDVVAFTYGSGGGGINNSTAAGGNGGGLLVINATTSLTVNGDITANGEIGSTGSSKVGGGGSGGGIDIDTAALTGTGSITADGGNGNFSGGYDSGGGGGGRIAIEADDGFVGTVSIAGGKTYGTATSGQNGSFYFDLTNVDGLCDSGTVATTCTVSSDYVLSDGFTFSGGGNLIVDGTGSLSVPHNTNAIGFNFTGDITLQNGSNILANLNNMQANNIDIQSGATIDASELGNSGGRGPGADENGIGSGFGDGRGSGSGGAGGGAYGGVGGDGESGPQPGGTAHGDKDPGVTAFTFGSGGGATNGRDYPGGFGGGLVVLSATADLTVNGNILANGGNGVADSSRSTGGGSGGAISLTAGGNILGSGNLEVLGGHGISGSGYESGAGGGGRIYIEADNPFMGTINAIGGSSSGGAGNGGLGSFYFVMTDTDGLCDTGTMAGTCTVSSDYLLSDGFVISGGGSLVVDATGSLSLPMNMNNFSFNMTGDITVQNGGSINGNITSMFADNVTIDSGGSINANAFGQSGGKRSGSISKDGVGTGGGEGDASGSSGSGGGGYGGAGGNGDGGTTGGVAYGDDDPGVTAYTYGSGGGGAQGVGAAGGNGGGLIVIDATSTLTVNGTITANGGDGIGYSNYAGAGGSGGGIDLVCNSIAGSGSISAAGGDGVNSSNYESGGGGGGRVSVDTTDASTFGGTFDVSGGTGPGTASDGGTDVDMPREI